jgi:transmembrane sensor
MSGASKHSSSKLSPQMLEEASEWFVEFSEGSVDVGMRGRFDAWLRRSPEHVQAYLKITALWEEASSLESCPTRADDELVARALADANVVQLASACLEAQRDGDKSEQGPSRPRPLWLALAASVALATLGAWFYVQRDTYDTALGEHRSIHLPDGSIAELNSHSRIRVRFNEQRREVALLEGQALFRVAKDELRPFVVATDDTRVRAVGTQFDVYRKSGSTVITVLEGRVAVLPQVVALQMLDREPRAPAHSEALTPHGSEVLLTMGEQLTVTPTTITPPRLADVTVATAWTRHKIAFQRAPLSEVVEEFNRYNLRQIVIVDASLEATRISGVFASTDPDALLRFLRDLPDFSIQETPDSIRIARK